jgi:hypothetical protein
MLPHHQTANLRGPSVSLPYVGGNILERWSASHVVCVVRSECCARCAEQSSHLCGFRTDAQSRMSCAILPVPPTRYGRQKKFDAWYARMQYRKKPLRSFFARLRVLGSGLRPPFGPSAGPVPPPHLRTLLDVNFSLATFDDMSGCTGPHACVLDRISIAGDPAVDDLLPPLVLFGAAPSVEDPNVR